MPKNSRSFPANISASFQELTAAAVDLNRVSDELAKSIGELDTALKALNLGIERWVTISESANADGSVSWRDELGFAKVSGKWGLALRTVQIKIEVFEDDATYWLFNEASRDLRIEAVELIPVLLAELTELAVLKKDQLRTKVDTVRRFIAKDEW